MINLEQGSISIYVNKSELPNSLPPPTSSSKARVYRKHNEVIEIIANHPVMDPGSKERIRTIVHEKLDQLRQLNPKPTT